ncbi:MAG: glycoside hydrolase family 140 protein [Chitinophagaceae bacterium]|nr:glycoside hydrolase family 140 protein [Chitinophagaceae bacterium]
MNKLLITAGICLLSLISAAQYSFPLKVSDNTRYLVDQKGKPFFYNGDTGWMLFLRLTKEETRQYLSDRKNKHFTAIQTMLTGFATFKDAIREKPFRDSTDLASINESYFDHVEWVVQQAESMGLLMSIAPLWAGCCGEGFGGKGAVGPRSILSDNGPQKCRAFGEYIGKRFAKYNNIIWIMGGDIDPFEDREVMNELALGIKSQARHHLLTYHASSSHSSTDVWPDTSWLDVVMTYTYFRGFNKAWNKNQPDVYEVNYKEYAKQPVKPFFLGESTYEGEHDAWGSPVQVRKQAYWSVLSGGTGNAYGSPLWRMDNNWKRQLELPGGNSLQYFYKLFQSKKWFELMPDSTSSVITSGAGKFAGNDYAVAAKHQKGKYIIAYIPSGRTFTINTSGIRGSKLKASWYNPANGETTLEGKYRNKGELSFTTPDANDWVLVVESH